MCAYRSIHGEPEHIVQQVVPDRADDIRRAHNIPSSSSLLAVCEELVLLPRLRSARSLRALDSYTRIVEVVLQRDPRVRFEGRRGNRPDVEAVMLRTCGTINRVISTMDQRAYPSGGENASE